MDVQSYCDMLGKQLVAWKAKIYDVIRVVDTISETDREKYFLSVRSLHGMVAEIDTQLEHLKTSCPPDWSPYRENIDRKMNELRQTLKNLSEQVGGPLIPDSLSWVSE